ncbi:hypothetical protein L1049_000256 [Liquidambar formosana]|uniref:E2 ubiquitin-conjugating enzyme n=1 Tax=Liquidambar formosana TaxID=63359 RepID=A0AAP0NCF9_LIQFO
MAQAARLNLRMQKELKLLLTDPPPGASFPLLSADSDLSPSSLSSIDAHIEGPEGTVYAKGIFHIKIQIPERYPFQPPSVNFATPIYHPNIDNGGRICLDILNLPPKGAWQPSLNISTVLTSIGLLLSEPNPDDGLMCEVSREYKYNRQAFDQKARSMTERYAKVGAGGNSSGIQRILTHSNPTMMEIEGPDKESKYEVNDHTVSYKNQCGISRNLSLESSGSQKRDAEGKANEVPTRHQLLSNSEDQMERGPKTQSKGVVDVHNLSHEKICGTRRKLSLESLGRSQKKDDDDKENVLPNHPSNMQQVFPSQSNSNMQQGALPLPQSVNHNELHSWMDPIDRMGNSFNNTNCKKLSLVGKKLSLGFKGSSQQLEKDNKENELPICNLPHPQPQSVSTVSSMPSLTSQPESYDCRAGNCGISVSQKKCGIGRKLSLEPLSQSQGSNDDSNKLLSYSLDLSTTPSKSLPVPEDCSYDGKRQSIQVHDGKIGVRIKQQRREESPISEAVIVLDSEDSEEERDVYLRSKLSLARKRLAGKWKAKA